MNFFEFADNLKKYPAYQFAFDLQDFLTSDEKIADLQREQWAEGEDSNGNLLGRYSKMTEILSGGIKKAGEPYNLFDTGDLYSKTRLLSGIKDNDLLFDMDSTGVNKPELLQKLGSRIFGLQDKNKEKFTAIAVEKAIQLLNTNLKLK